VFETNAVFVNALTVGAGAGVGEAMAGVDDEPLDPLPPQPANAIAPAPATNQAR
jgi:hypothetical protein